jgi:hypothetical protein
VNLLYFSVKANMSIRKKVNPAPKIALPTATMTVCANATGIACEADSNANPSDGQGGEGDSSAGDELFGIHVYILWINFYTYGNVCKVDKKICPVTSVPGFQPSEYQQRIRR